MEPMKHTLKLEGLEKGWQGSLVMEAPRHTERMRVLSEFKVHKMRQAGNKKDKAKSLEVLFEEQLPMLVSVYEKYARALIQEVNIVGPNGEVIDDVETFDRHPACGQCFAEVSAAYLEGFVPGKKTSKS